MKKSTVKRIYASVLLLFALLFVVRFGGLAILRGYVEAGIGNCRTLPVLCTLPEKDIVNPGLDKDYIDGLLPYSFRGIKVSVPRGFTVIKGQVKKVYYKRKKFDTETPVIYLLYQKPGFFPGIFPQLKKQGINDNYEFVKRTIYAEPKNINSVTDAFFVIMKAVFTPDIGDQKNVRMVKFSFPGKRGFVTYNLTPSKNYFDCDLISADDIFCKVYIKDRGAALGLDEVLTVISTLETSDIPASEITD